MLPRTSPLCDPGHTRVLVGSRFSISCSNAGTGATSPWQARQAYLKPPRDDHLNCATL